MADNDYYRSHWQQIEDERVARYEQMFMWRPELEPLLEPAAIGPGHTVVDFGCGPGFIAQELATRVGPSGRVHGVDLNARFVDDANERARAAGVSNVTFHQSGDGAVPLADESVDRVLCKNVLEYVPDAAAQVVELRRVLKPGGRLHLLDSDWDFVVVEPWSPDTVREFFAAAAPAFREPNIGRKLPGLLVDAGFEDISVRLMAGVDRAGRMLSVLQNMAGYARRFGTLDDARLDTLLAQARAAVESGRFMAILPQFVVTATR